MSLDPFQLEPAHDLGMSHRDRVLSLRRESGLIETCTRCAWWSAMRGYLRCYHRLEIDGRENLPESPPYILIANHTSHLDAMILASQLHYRDRDRIFPIAAGDTFFQTPIRSAFAWACINALPMWRHNCGRHALNELRHRLSQEPCIYILFPEGTRSRDGQLGSFRAGLGMLVAQTSIPVVPCLVEGAYRALPSNRRWPKPCKLKLNFGQSVNFKDQPNTKAGWQTIVRQCESALQSMAKSSPANGA